MIIKILLINHLHYMIIKNIMHLPLVSHDCQIYDAFKTHHIIFCLYYIVIIDTTQPLTNFLLL